MSGMDTHSMSRLMGLQPMTRVPIKRCRDAVPTAQLQDLLCPAALLESTVIRDPACGIRTGIGIRADLAASAVESSAATTSERTMDVSHTTIM